MTEVKLHHLDNGAMAFIKRFLRGDTVLVQQGLLFRFWYKSNSDSYLGFVKDTNQTRIQFICTISYIHLTPSIALLFLEYLHVI